MSLKSWPRRYWSSFSYVGLVFAAVFFAASLSPSLLPRIYIVQGLLSGIALAIGYGVGVFIVWLWHYLELSQPGAKIERVAKWLTTIGVAVICVIFLWRARTDSTSQETVHRQSIQRRRELRSGQNCLAELHP